MDLNDLQKNVTNMSDEELMSLLLKVRQDRRTSKKSIVAAPKKTQKADSGAVFNAVEKLSAEERANLLQKLKEELT